MIHPEMDIPHYNEFSENILGHFRNMEDFSQNFHENKSKISSLAVDILKKFHIFWNVHRQRK